LPTEPEKCTVSATIIDSLLLRQQQDKRELEALTIALSKALITAMRGTAKNPDQTSGTNTECKAEVKYTKAAKQSTNMNATNAAFRWKSFNREGASTGIIIVVMRTLRALPQEI